MTAPLVVLDLGTPPSSGNEGDAPVNMPIVLSLYDRSGEWSRPFRGSYRVIRVDFALADKEDDWALDLAAPEAKAAVLGRLRSRGAHVEGILAAPPCDCFTRASAWLWPSMDTDGRTVDGLRMVDLVLDLVMDLQPRWWALENPPGRLWRRVGGGLRQDALGPPRLVFHPWEYGGHAPEDPASRRSKRTYVWGCFPLPIPRPMDPDPYPAHLAPGRRDPIRQMGSRGKAKRARTPTGFARAFAAAVHSEERP